MLVYKFGIAATVSLSVNISYTHIIFIYIVSRSGLCQCNSEGVCPCKATVIGKKCATCAPGKNRTIKSPRPWHNT